MSKVGKWVLHKFDIAAKFFFYTVAALATVTIGAGVLLWVIQMLRSFV